MHGSSPSLAAPVPGVYRRDRQLLVQRGADLSRACLVCARPASGGPIVRRLSVARWLTRKPVGGGGGSIMFWWDLIAFIFSMVWFVVDYPTRRKRIVKIGFCDSHRGKYVGFRWGGLVAKVLGLPLVIVGLFAQHLPPGLEPALFVVGMLLFMTGIFLPWAAPRVRLASETKDGMWVEGAGTPFLELYPPMPTPPQTGHK